MGLDKLLELIFTYIGKWWPIEIIEAWSEAILLRGGKFKRVLKPGWYFLPLKMLLLDRVYEVVVVTTTLDIPSQTLVTKDDVPISISHIIKYNISDTEKYYLKISDQTDAIKDTAQGIIKTVIVDREYKELKEKLDQIDKEITKLLRDEVKKYGIAIEKATISSFCKTPAFKLFNDSNSALST